MGSNEHRKESPEHQKADPAERTHLMQEIMKLVADDFGQQDEHEYRRLRSYLYHDVFQHLQDDPGMRLWVAHRFRKEQVNNEGQIVRYQLLPSDLLLPETEQFRIELEKTREDCNQMVHKWLENINFATQKHIGSRRNRARRTILFDLRLTLPFVVPGAPKSTTWSIQWQTRYPDRPRIQLQTEWYHSASSETSGVPLLRFEGTHTVDDLDWSAICEWCEANERKPPPVLEWTGPE